MLERHAKYTGSLSAKGILERWDEGMKYFVRVMPRDYAAVLKKNEQEQPEVTHAS